MSPQYKTEEKNLRKIISEHISCKSDGKINLSIYYKNRKLSNVFIKNDIHKDPSNSHVVNLYINMYAPAICVDSRKRILAILQPA